MFLAPVILSGGFLYIFVFYNPVLMLFPLHFYVGVFYFLIIYKGLTL